MANPITVLAGTTKGLFLIKGQAGDVWQISGPHCQGWPINHAVGDAARGTIWAAGGGDWNGAGVWRSDDAGATWVLSHLADCKFDQWVANDPDFAAMVGKQPAPPAPFTGQVSAIWSLGQVGDRLYAGAKPATLFASDDGGVTWSQVQALSDHPSGPGWEPGGAGLVLHSIVSDPGNPDKIWVGISAAGVFATEDGGRTWDRRNRRSNSGGTQDGEDVGLCVHNIVRAPGDASGRGDLMYQQNHQGVFRSRDGGRNWDEITAGLPSKFGFPIAVHPHDPNMIFVLPLNGDSIGRFPPDASAAVWRSMDGGDTWADMRDGLPGKNCYFTVLRQAMDTDLNNPAGVYFGTNSGTVFASHDNGQTWAEIAQHLPTVLCITVLHPA